MTWSIDGIEWAYPCNIDRVAEVRASDISGMMLDKTYFNDVMGTWLRYTVTIAIPFGKEADYAEIYDRLTDPVNYHTFVLPYNYDEVTIVGRVEHISDSFVRLAGGKGTWKKTSFEIISSAPYKEATLEGIENHGLPSYPDEEEPDVGVLMEYTENGWAERFYADADDRSY